MRRICLGILVLAVSVAAPALAKSEAPATRPLPYAQAEKCSVSVPKIRLECGQLHVPQHRARAGDTAVQRLSYVILKSTSKAPKPDPIVFLTGGPGSSAIFFLNVLAKSALLDSRDIIAIEQRGNGYSSPNLLCDVGEPETPEAAIASVGKCYSDFVDRKLDLQSYNLEEAARDLDDLRTALAIPSWNVLGTSYGSFWALRYLAMEPQGVRAVILDSPYPPQADPRDSWMGHLNALSVIFTECTADPACEAAYPQLRDRFVGLLEAVAKEPIKRAGGTFTAFQIFDLVHNANFETATVLSVPRLIDAMLREDFGTIEKIVSIDPYGRPKGFDMKRAYAAGLNINSPCIDDAPFQSVAGDRLTLLEEWPAAVVEVAKLSGFEKSNFCTTVWKVAPGSPAMNEPVHSSVPALITVGALDPETPPQLGVIMQRTLPNATLAVLPDSSHAALSIPSACTDRVIGAFIDAPAGNADVACFAGDRPKFSLPSDPIGPPARGR